MKKVFVFLILAVCLYFLINYNQDAFPQNGELHTIRVAVIRDTPRINISVKGGYKIVTLNEKEKFFEGKDLKNIPIKPDKNGLVIAEGPFEIPGIKIVPETNARIFINGRLFKGPIEIFRTKNTKLLVVNYIDIEDYLLSVLPKEVSPRWHIEALKAQAITARTFAIYQIKSRKKKIYDVTADAYSQMYGGITSRKWNTTRAVRLTRGQVLTYKGNTLPAYYHAACGGHTEDAGRLWNIKLLPLKGVKCPYCYRTPHYKWHLAIGLDEVENKLKEKGYSITGISSIDTDERDSSGRIRHFILGSMNSNMKIPVNDFRSTVGLKLIKSTNCWVKLRKGTVYFKGFGWGHGVGLCQWGSYTMAKRGHKAEDILKFYYPGAEIARY